MWEPGLKIIDTRFVGRNILVFVAANQADALNWANDGDDLKPFKQITESVANRSAPMFPSLAIQSEGSATDFSGDVNISPFEISFEAVIEGSPDTLPLLSRRYKHALESMLLNIPKADLLADSSISHFTVDSIESDMPEIKANEMQNKFYQEFTTKVTYIFYGSAE
jgi:hypothetical protein